MNNLKFVPEGWNNETTKLTQDNWQEYKNQAATLQGIVNSCDDNCNLYIKFENGLQGKIPREEVEAIKINENGIPKENLCMGKVHKFVQFKNFEQLNHSTVEAYLSSDEQIKLVYIFKVC